MGHSQQRERECKKAAKACQRLDNLFSPCPVAKKRKTADDRTPAESIAECMNCVDIQPQVVVINAGQVDEMQVMLEKEAMEVSLHVNDEDKDHQAMTEVVSEAKEAPETVIEADDDALTAAFSSTTTGISRQAPSTLLQHPTMPTEVGTTSHSC